MNIHTCLALAAALTAASVGAMVQTAAASPTVVNEPTISLNAAI